MGDKALSKDKTLYLYLIRGTYSSEWAPRGVVRLPAAESLTKDQRRIITASLSLTYPGWRQTEFLIQVTDSRWAVSDLIELATMYTPDGEERK